MSKRKEIWTDEVARSHSYIDAAEAEHDAEVNGWGDNIVFITLDDECDGHESTNGPIGNVEYCDGSCK